MSNSSLFNHFENRLKPIRLFVVFSLHDTTEIGPISVSLLRG